MVLTFSIFERLLKGNMKKIIIVQLTLLTLISCFCFLTSNKVTGQTDSPFCNDCGSVSSKPLCNGSQIPKCPTGKGNPECRLIGEVCTSVCINGNSSDPDADFCEDSTSTSSTSSSSSGVIISVTSSSGSGSINTIDPNFAGIWKGGNIRPYVNPNSLIGCAEIQSCSNKNLSCKQDEVFLPKVCTKCARCVKASKTITLNLCVNDGQLKGTVTHSGVLNNATITSQTILTDNVVLLNLKDTNGETATLILQLTGNKKLSGTFSYGIGFDGKKLGSSNNCSSNGG